MEACYTEQKTTTTVRAAAAQATALACSDCVPLESILVVAHNMMSPNDNMDSNDILSDLQLLEKETNVKTHSHFIPKELKQDENEL